ncbi:hydrolase [Niallia sp. Krafla_26]|uniref:hydrolase n=1 Tax=Niallia sp. Krafla_26 TaxID=3064703 RepID=UPI003D175EFA
MFTVEEACLIVIDVQGKLANIVNESETIISNIAKLVQSMKVLNVPVIWMEQNPSRLGGTKSEIAQYMTGKPIEKMDFNGCLNDDVQAAIKESGRTKFLITGIETHICIYQTARALKSQGYEVEVVVDAVSSRTKENKEIGITKMQSLGILPTSTEMILYELLQTGEHEKFKEILKLVK